MAPWQHCLKQCRQTMVPKLTPATLPARTKQPPSLSYPHLARRTKSKASVATITAFSCVCWPLDSFTLSSSCRSTRTRAEEQYCWRSIIDSSSSTMAKLNSISPSFYFSPLGTRLVLPHRNHARSRDARHSAKLNRKGESYYATNFHPHWAWYCHDPNNLPVH